MVTKKQILEYTFRREKILSYRNLALVSIVLIIAGSFSNSLAIYSNDGRMPVLVNEIVDDKVYEGTSGIYSYYGKVQDYKSFILGDIFRLDIKGFTIIFSIGDILAIIGMFSLLIFSGILEFFSFKYRKEDKLMNEYLKKLKNG